MRRLLPSAPLFPYTTLFRSREDPGAFQCDIDAEILVRKLGRVALGRDLDRAATDVDGVAVHFHFARSEEHTSELQSRENLVCRLLLEKKKRIEQFLYAFYDD